MSTTLSDIIALDSICLIAVSSWSESVPFSVVCFAIIYFIAWKNPTSSFIAIAL